MLDFGLAKLTERPEGRGVERYSMDAGTAAYMSPEQAEGKNVDARSDIFSFGAVLYEMLTGHSSFRRESTSATVAAILRDDPLPLSEVVPGLQRILVHCLQKDPNRRYHAMADVRIALEDLKGEPPALAAAPSRRTKRWVIDAALLLVPVAVGAVWVLLRPTAYARLYRSLR